MLIVTPRLLLRDFEPGDAPALHEYLRDPDVVRYEPYEPFTRAMAEFEARARALSPEHRAVALRPEHCPQLSPGAYPGPAPCSGRLIGNLYAPRRACGEYELGFAFNRAYWGRGYAGEAARALMECLFSRDAQRVFARCDARNLRSQRLLARLGMRPGARTSRIRVAGEDRAILTYSITRREWARRAGVLSTNADEARAG